MKEKLGKSSVMLKAARKTKKIASNDSVIFAALNNAANEHFLSKSVGKPTFIQKKVLDMQ